VRLVVLPVTVMDHKHQFVSGLSASHFRVYEDGQEQTLSLFRPEDMPVTVGLVVDHSGSMSERKMDVLEGAEDFVRASNSQDDEFVVNFNDEVTFGLPPNVPFTSDLEALRTALSDVSADGETALYDATAVALDHMRTARNDKKKVLILITDGEDNASHHGFAQVLRMAQTLNVQIYAVGLFDHEVVQYRMNPSSQSFSKVVFDDGKPVLTLLAKETGGKAYFPKTSKEVADVCLQIASGIRHQYTLGYSPKDVDHSGYRKVRVQVVGQGKLVTDTRAGYFLPEKLQ
jgi:VWFA-related protein